MAQSNSVAELAKALAKARAKIGHPQRNAEGRVGTRKYRYADLGAVLDAITPALAESGVTVLQLPEYREDTGLMLLRTIILHSSGEWIDSTYELPTGAKPQDMGSALTYARRYALSAILGVASEDDDDGARAQNSGSTTASKPKQQRATAPQSRKPADDTMPIDDGIKFVVEQLVAHGGSDIDEWIGDRDVEEALSFLVNQVFADTETIGGIDVLSKSDCRTMYKEAQNRISVDLQTRRDVA